MISGYLITTIIISEMAEGKFSIVSFYERRARRILPALFFVMTACLPFAWFWLTPSDLIDFGKSLVAVSTFSSNILFWLESGYFDTAAELKPLLHTWSLAVEEQYYVFFPIFLMLTWRLRGKWILGLLSVMFVFSLGVAQWGAYNTPSAAFYLLPTRGWELLVGVFAAFYLHNFPYLKSHSVNQVLSLLGLGMIVLSIIVFDENTPFPSFYTLFPTVGTGLLILCAVPETVAYNALSLRPIVGVGLISYSAYLWHQPLLAFARHRLFGEMSDLILIPLCCLSLFLAWVSWRFVEKPFRRREVTSFRFLLITLLMTSICFIGVGLVIQLKDGFPNRLDTNLKWSTLSVSPFRGSCHMKYAPCEYFEDSVEWATFGDFHISELSLALAAILRERDVGIQQNSYDECKPSLSDVSSPCYEWTRNTINRLANSNTIKNVVVSFRLTYYLYGESLGVYPALPSENRDEERKVIWNDLLAMLNGLSDSGKQVYFVVQPPELPRHIEKLVFWKSESSERTQGVTRRWWDQRNRFVIERLSDISKDIIVVDATDQFCDQLWCYGDDTKGFLYADDDHISVYGALLIVNDWVLRSNN